MNIKELNKHLDATLVIEPEKLARDGSNANRFFCADVVGSRRFAQNYGGYPRSEIAQMNEAVSLEEQINLLNYLQDYTPSNNPTAGLSDAEIMLGHKSKYLQAASEKIAWLESQLEQRDAKRYAEAMKNQSNIVDKTEKVDEVDVNPE